jgi:uncharacterized protein (DUF433 family)
VVVDELGTPLIEGTTMKVIELVLETHAYGWGPDELRFQHTYFTLGQIHSALAYYGDHKEELDHDIKRRLERVEQIRRDVGPSQLVEGLKLKSCSRSAICSLY